MKYGKRKCSIAGYVIFSAAVGAAAFVWGVLTEQQAHFEPDYPMENIEQLVLNEELDEGQYENLFFQTGLGRQAVDALRAEGRTEEILYAKQRFFAPIEVECSTNTFATSVELIARMQGKQAKKAAAIPCVEPGDILISFCCHFFGWRNGHAAIVTDKTRGLVLEAQMIGTDSEVTALESWADYPSFAVLRLKGADKEARGQIAAWAETNLKDIPYRLTAGLSVGERYVQGEEITEETITGTQCAQLVWYAYARFGYDIDSDGGRIVTPKDLFDSPLLEIVQIYGMRPDELYSRAR